jgi:hypothetical protein
MAPWYSWYFNISANLSASMTSLAHDGVLVSPEDEQLARDILSGVASRATHPRPTLIPEPGHYSALPNPLRRASVLCSIIEPCNCPTSARTKEIRWSF